MMPRAFWVDATDVEIAKLYLQDGLGLLEVERMLRASGRSIETSVATALRANEELKRR